jgi:hypothetical protein
MQENPPRSGLDKRRLGGLSLRPQTPAEPVSPLFRTGPYQMLEGAPEVASQRTERGARIIADLRRTFVYAVVFLGVGLILALFVSTLWG